MNKVKIILIYILSIGFIGIVNAQGDKQTNQLTKPEPKKNPLTFEVKTDVQKATDELTKILKKEVTIDKTVKIATDSTQSVFLSIDTPKVDLSNIDKRLKDRGFVLLEKEETVVAVKVKSQTPVEKYNPEIDKFLNLEDASIFTNNFKSYDLQEIHPSRRNYYQAVEKIHDFGEKLKNIESNLSNSKIDELAKQVNISTEAVKNSLLEAAKTEIVKAEKDLDGLIPFVKELDLLSPQQKQHYKSLKDKFNDLYSKIYP